VASSYVRLTTLIFAGAVVVALSGVAAPAVRNVRALASAISAPSSDQARIEAAVERAGSSVAAIDVDLVAGPASGSDMNDGAQVSAHMSGSGFVYDRNGDIVTNAHVVSAPNGTSIRAINISFANGYQTSARVFSIDRDVDLAVLKVELNPRLPAPLPLGESTKLRSGAWAIAIGEPLGLKQTVTVGVISAFNRSEQIGDKNGGDARTFGGLLQTSAPINPGNSGGPLIDLDGRVIGINQAVAGGAQGIGFAIPIDAVKSNVAGLLQHPQSAPPVAIDGEQKEADANDDSSNSSPVSR
jgi:S1-C subfamily serine protease